MKVRVLDSDRMEAIEASSIVDGDVDIDGNLILHTYGGTAINAGLVRGAKGDPGDNVDAKAYSDNGDAATLASAESYSDGKLVEAKAYSDDKLVEAKSYVDNHPLIKGTPLVDGDNLDTKTTPGYYTQTTNASAATGTNYPRLLAGILEVRTNADADGVFVYQRYTVYGGYNPEAYVRTKYNGTWSSWSLAGPPGTLLRIGSNIRTTDTTSTTSEYNICNFTLPNPVNGDVYRVHAGSNIVPDTAGMYTGLRIKHASGANVGGTQIAQIYLDHRISGRVVGGEVTAEFTYTGSTGASGYNVVLVGFPGGGGSKANCNSGQPGYLYVDRVL